MLLAKDSLIPSTDIDAVRAYLRGTIELAKDDRRVRDLALAEALMAAAIEILSNRPDTHPCWAFPAGETAKQRVRRLVTDVAAEAKDLVNSQAI